MIHREQVSTAQIDKIEQVVDEELGKKRCVGIRLYAVDAIFVSRHTQLVIGRHDIGDARFVMPTEQAVEVLKQLADKAIEAGWGTELSPASLAISSGSVEIVKNSPPAADTDDDPTYNRFAHIAVSPSWPTTTAARMQEYYDSILSKGGK